MIIQYTILFSLHSLTIEAAISSSTSSGSIRGSAAAVDDNDSIVGDGHRELELLNNSSNNDDSHRLLQVATDVSMFLDCVVSMRAYRYHIFDYTNTNFYSHCNSLSLSTLSPLQYLYSNYPRHRIGHCTVEYQTNAPP